MRYSYSWTLDIYVLFITNGNDRKMVRKLKGSQNIVILLLSSFSFSVLWGSYILLLFRTLEQMQTAKKRREENRRRRRCRLEFHSLQTSDFSSYTTPSFLSSFLLLLRFLRLIVSFHFYYGLMVVVVVSFL